MKKGRISILHMSTRPRGCPSGEKREAKKVTEIELNHPQFGWVLVGFSSISVTYFASLFSLKDQPLIYIDSVSIPLVEQDVTSEMEHRCHSIYLLPFYLRRSEQVYKSSFSSFISQSPNIEHKEQDGHGLEAHSFLKSSILKTGFLKPNFLKYSLFRSQFGQF